MKGEACYFGGWPSQIVGGKCKIPSEASGSHCGEGEISCNPALFPTADGSPACAGVSATFANLSDRCEESSRDGIPYLKKNIDVAKLAKLSDSIKTFCDENPKYDACDNLASRLLTLTGKNIGSYEERLPVSHEGDPAPVKKQTRPVSLEVRINALTAGKHSSGPAPKIPALSHSGDKILSDCRAMLKRRDLKGDQSALGTCSVEGPVTLKNQKDFEKLTDSLSRVNFANHVVDTAMRSSLLALIANEVQFGSPPVIPVGSEKALAAYLKSHYPDLAKNPRYAKTVHEIYGQASSAFKAGNLKSRRPQGASDEFNSESLKVNALCKQIHDEAVKKFGSTGKLMRFWNEHFYAPKEKEEFFKAAKSRLDVALNTFQKSTPTSSFFATDSYKDNVFDPLVNYGEQCAQNPSYMPIKSPIGKAEISEGTAGIRKLLGQAMSDLNKKSKVIANGDTDAVDGVLKEFVKKDPSILFYTMRSESDPAQKASAALVCGAVSDVLETNRNWQFGDAVLGGVGVICGTVLLASGIGAVIGAPMIVASTAALTASGIALGVVGTYHVSTAAQMNNYSKQILESSEQKYAAGAQSVSAHVEANKTSQAERAAAKDRAVAGFLEIVPAVQLAAKAALVAKAPQPAKAPQNANAAQPAKAPQNANATQPAKVIQPAKPTTNTFAQQEANRLFGPKAKHHFSSRTIFGSRVKPEVRAQELGSKLEKFSADYESLMRRYKAGLLEPDETQKYVNNMGKWKGDLDLMVAKMEKVLKSEMRTLGGRENFLKYVRNVDGDQKSVELYKVFRELDMIKTWTGKPIIPDLPPDVAAKYKPGR